MPAILDECSSRLLLVDDDPTLCRVLSKALQTRGFEVTVAHEVDTAARAARLAPPDYAVVDLKLPGPSGLSLIDALKALNPKMRIVVLTGFASISTSVEAIKLGAVHYLAKPADADEIVVALHYDRGDPSVAVKSQPMSLKRLEWEHIQKVLTAHDGNVSATARSLRMHLRTLQRKLTKRPMRE
jgi:two-component system, response regulator RegA